MIAKEIFLNTLYNQNYIEVPFPIEAQLIQEAINAFFAFLEEPEEIKNFIDFSIAPEHRRGDVGFKHREAGTDIYNDSKDFFHFHPALFKRYENFLSKRPVVARFAHKAQPIWDLAYKTVYQLLSMSEERFPGIVEKIFATQEVHLLLRFLKYNWQESGKYLAKPHFDAGSFTLAIAESCPGLRIGSGPHDLKLVEHKEKHALFMLSSNFKQIMNTNELSACWHDVIQIDETCIGKPFARWAIVAFIEAHGVKALPRSETHKWYAGTISL